ncbi:MAG: HAD hydrolase family protein [Candidatus Caenarcaniphilales bacterium]|jgi:3-deoxy-D-manno-octulosonate 8-phosphate phosphatase (KDO 8-P phosphatase)|nr:HAD hydrolase family protein [Candidatus Caenarcaniphilales bacterium]
MYNISDKFKNKAQKIKMIGFDVDGVLTDGSIFIAETGEVFKQFHALDGHGMRLAANFGIKICIISARKSPSVHKRFEGFGFESDIYTGVIDKWSCMQEIMMIHNLDKDEIAFIGDDSLDIPVLEQVGLAACPPNAHFSVQKHIHYITEKSGGHGAARELIDVILIAQEKIPNS